MQVLPTQTYRGVISGARLKIVDASLLERAEILSIADSNTLLSASIYLPYFAGPSMIKVYTVLTYSALTKCILVS